MIDQVMSKRSGPAEMQPSLLSVIGPEHAMLKSLRRQ
jgi:hypothetical protein